MKGINYITDEKQVIKSVVIDYDLFKKPTDELEDIFDTLIAEARKNDKNIPFEKVLQSLKSKGKL
jgi:hypothetical protein